MGSFFVTLDNTPYQAKPKAQVGAITERLKVRGGVLMDHDSFTEAVYRGCTWVPGTFTKGGKRDERGKLTWGSFISLQIFGLDFDNDAPVLNENGKPIKGKKRPLLPHEPGYLNPTQALKRCESLGVMPFLLYFSFSARQGWPKYRLCFDLGEPIADEQAARGYILKMLEIFPEADQKCINANRLFFGSPGKVHTFREVWP